MGPNLSTWSSLYGLFDLFPVFATSLQWLNDFLFLTVIAVDLKIISADFFNKGIYLEFIYWTIEYLKIPWKYNKYLWCLPELAANETLAKKSNRTAIFIP